MLRKLHHPNTRVMNSPFFIRQRKMYKIFFLTLLSCCISNGMEAQVVNPAGPLDSIVYYDYRNAPDSVMLNKIEYQRNSGGNITCKATYQWNQQQNRWIMTGRIENTYDGEGRLANYSSYQWDATRKVWIGMHTESRYPREEYSYDDRGNMIQKVSYLWRSDLDRWETALKTEWTYDDAGIETSLFLWTWSRELSTWTCYSKKMTTYNGNSTRTDKYLWNVKQNDWDSGERTDTIFDQHHRAEQVYTSYWEPETDKWDLYRQKIVTYNDCGAIESVNTQQWNSSLQIWTDNTKSLYEFDSGCNPVLDHSYRFDKTSNEWLTSFKRTERTFDGSGNRLSEIGFLADDYNNWIPMEKSTFFYDSNDREDSTVQFYWDKNPKAWAPNQAAKKQWNSEGLLVLDAQYFWNAAAGVWNVIKYSTWTFNDKGFIMVEESNQWIEGTGMVPMFKEFYYYSETSGITGPVADNQISVYPNPTEGVLTLGGIGRPVDLQLFSITGQYIRTYYRVENSIDVSELPDGQYILFSANAMNHFVIRFSKQ